MLASVIVLGIGIVAQAQPSLGDLARKHAKTPEIALRYNWPDGMTARVESRQSVERHSGKTAANSSVSLSVTMRVSSHPEGRLIRFENLRVADFPGAPEGDALMEQVTGLALPDLVVDKAGEFVRLADVKRTKAAVDSIFAPLLAQHDLKPGQQDLIARVTSEEMLTALGAQEWTMLVASWNGADLEPGKPVEFESEEPTPIAPDVPIKMQYRAILVSQAPCDENAPAKLDCVLLELRSTPESASLKALLERVMKDAMEDDPASHVVMEKYEVVNTIRLVTEPATLRPHWLDTEKRVDMVITSRDESRKHIASNLQRRTSRYTYPEASAK